MTKTVVSLTPVSLERDSRTLKMAASFARKGYRSIVLERLPSQRTFDSYGIETLSLNTNVSKKTEGQGTTSSLKSNLITVVKFFWHALRYIGLGAINDRLSFILYKRDFHQKYSLDHVDIPQANIYIFHSYEFVDFALKLPKDSLILYDAHDYYQEINPASEHSSLVRTHIYPYQKDLEHHLLMRSNLFTTVSRGLCKKYREAFGKNAVTIQNAHDARIDSNPKGGIREYLELKEEDILICAIGNKKMGMAIAQVTQAFKRLPSNYHLVFVGNGYEMFDSENPHIHYIPGLHANEVVPFVQSADLGIILYYDLTENYKYALPNGFFQSLSAGLPIVFPKQLQEISALHQQYLFGISVDIKDVTAVYDAILEVSENREVYKDGVCKFNENVNWQKEEEILLSLVNSVHATN